MKSRITIILVLIFVLWALTFSVTRIRGFFSETYDFWRQSVVIEIGAEEVPDSVVVGPSVKATLAKNCYGLDIEIELLTEHLRNWRRKQLELCENYSDIRIQFEGREFLFSYDEFKAVINYGTAAVYDTLSVDSLPPSYVIFKGNFLQR